MKKRIYQLLYKILLVLSNRYNNQAIIRYKLAVGSTLLLLNGGQIQAQVKTEDENNTAPSALQTEAAAQKDTVSHYCYTAVTMPEFPGGEKELNKYMAKGIRKYAYLDSCADGQCIVSFKIDKTGKARDPEIVQALSPDQDTACLRIINDMPLWKPGKVNDREVNIRRTVPFTFDGYDLRKVRTQQQIMCYIIHMSLPEFPGGPPGLESYLFRHAIHQSWGDETTGEVIISFWIDEEGKTFEPVIIKSSDPELNEPALKIIAEMPRWSPAQHSRKVRYKQTITIPFRKIKKL